MIFKAKEKKDIDLFDWNPWFAWRPIKICGYWHLFCTVERRALKRRVGPMFDPDNGPMEYEYRVYRL